MNNVRLQEKAERMSAWEEAAANAQAALRAAHDECAQLRKDAERLRHTAEEFARKASTAWDEGFAEGRRLEREDIARRLRAAPACFAPNVPALADVIEAGRLP